MTGAVDIVLVTATEMPKPDPESSLVIAALGALGLNAILHPWDRPMDWAEVPLVVSRTPWDYFLRPAEFLAWARDVAASTRIENPFEILRWNSHKSYLVDLDRAGVPVVPTTVVASGSDEMIQASELARHREVVIKPAVSGGAVGALWATGDSDAAREHLRRLSQVGDVLVQPYVASVEQSGEVSLVYFDGIYSHAVVKMPARGEYRVHEHHGGSVHVHEPRRDERAVAEAALGAAPGPTSYARIDLVAGDHGPLVMEAELIEPELFLPMAPGSAARFAETLVPRLR